MTDLLRLPSHFQDGMILQQKVSFHLYGRCRPGATVTVRLEREPFDGRAVSPLDNQYGLLFDEMLTADDQGVFAVDLPASDASYDPHTLTVAGAGTVIMLEDILFGEVWLTAGQSNMQMPLEAVESPTDTESMATCHYVRVLSQSATGLGHTMPSYLFNPAENMCDARWLWGDRPGEMAHVSAIGFSFARKVQLALKLPVGLIETALSGSCIHAWISRLSLEKHEAIRRHITARGLYRDESDWDQDSDDPMAQHRPAALYNNKLAPMKTLALRGVLWYQGESDYLYPDYYREALQLLVADWHELFRPAGNQGLAFFMVQPAPFFYGHTGFTQLAAFNEMLAAVRRKLPCPTALLPVYDIPLTYNDAVKSWRHPVHPTTKRPVGERLALMAFGLLYRRKAPHTSPECSNIEIVGNKMLLSFSQIGEGLCLTGPGERLRGFTLCGPDRVFVAAQARILYGVRVMVWHDQIKEPQAVAYAYADMNQDANLSSRDHLPVVPFRSDRHEARHHPPHEWVHCDSLQVWCAPDQVDVHQTGWHPRWCITRGEGQLTIEPLNKMSGDGSLFVRYLADERQEVILEPQLHYASLFPPLDLSPYEAIVLSLFNPDQQMKTVRLALATGASDAPLVVLKQRSVVVSALRWQTFVFPLEAISDQLDRVHRLALIIEDKKKRGTLYLDQIQLIRSH